MIAAELPFTKSDGSEVEGTRKGPSSKLRGNSFFIQIIRKTPTERTKGITVRQRLFYTTNLEYRSRRDEYGSISQQRRGKQNRELGRDTQGQATTKPGHENRGVSKIYGRREHGFTAHKPSKLDTEAFEPHSRKKSSSSLSGTSERNTRLKLALAPDFGV